MDLKGSLIDTNLRIHPSTKLIEFFKSMPIDNNVPINIIKLVKGRDYELRSKPKVEHILKIPIHLNSHDIEILNKIKATCKTEDSESVEVLEEKTILQSEVELSNNNSSMSSTPKKDKNEDLKQSKTECNDKSNMSEQDTNDKTKLSNKDSTKRSKKSKEECNEKIKDGSFDEAKETADEEELYLETSDIDWLYGYLQKSKSKGESVAYLHQLLDGIDIKMPQNKVIKRNPELEARCVKLRAQQEAREYRKMTKSVDNVRMRFPEDSISFQLKQVNRHLIAIGQFILSIFAGFLFGFKGVEWMIGSLDFGFRLLLGVMCALIISLAEIYFLAKKLNEELNIPETVQLGGPPKFADQQKYHEENVKSRAINKEHQD